MVSDLRHVFVTGAAGFIGSNLSKYLLDQGVKVTGFDNFFSGKQSNINRLLNHPSRLFTFVKGDITDKKQLVEAISPDTDLMVNLAAQVSVMRSLEDPMETHHINDGGFLTVHAAARDADVKCLVYATTCAVYGDNDALPISEDELPTPLSPYAASKLSNEYYAQSLSTRYLEMKTVGLRFFNIFGAWQDPYGGYAAVIPKWISQIAQGGQCCIFGDGSATRDFCHVDNVCAAILAVSDKEFVPKYPVYNIGTGMETRIDELYKIIVDVLKENNLTPKHTDPEFRPHRHGDILRSVADTSRAEKEFGYMAHTSLIEGLRKTLRECPVDHWVSVQK